MPINFTTYIDTPGAPRRTVYPDFTVAVGGCDIVAVNGTYNIPHGCGLPVIPPAGLLNFDITDRPIVSWILYAGGIFGGGAFVTGSLLVSIGNDVNIFMADWRLYALNAGLNVMEGLFLPGNVAQFRIINGGHANSHYEWTIKAQGL